MIDGAAYLLTALMAWTHQPAEALQPWADAIAAHCDGKEECTQLASIGFWESNFASWVLDGSCNDRAWRESHKGWLRVSCDGGHAFGPFQLHDARARGASPDEQVRIAVALLKTRPSAWSTWTHVHLHAAWWMATH